MLRQVIERAIERGEYDIASATATHLGDLLLESGRLREALAAAETLLELSAQAGYGPWTMLADERQRLQTLDALGEHERVLSEVEELRQRMAELPEESGQMEGVTPWMARERILDTGRSAATRLRRWEQVLSFVEEIQESERRRRAPVREQATTAFNAHGALIELGRLQEARSLLDRCRAVFEDDHDAVRLGAVFSALAALEARLGHHQDAIEFAERALRYAYVATWVQEISSLHANLAIYLADHDGARDMVVAHGLAAILVSYQTDSGMLSQHLDNLPNLSKLDTQAVLPASFEDLCKRVDRVPGVRFRELFQQLPLRAPNGDVALAEVLRLALRRNS
jgi:tetratricopeptide (TPR) repeat protein